ASSSGATWRASRAALESRSGNRRPHGGAQFAGVAGGPRLLRAEWRAGHRSVGACSTAERARTRAAQSRKRRAGRSSGRRRLRRLPLARPQSGVASGALLDQLADELGAVAAERPDGLAFEHERETD